MMEKEKQKNVDKDVLILDDEQEGQNGAKVPQKYYNFHTFIKYYIENKGDFVKTAEQLNIRPQQIIKEIFKDAKKRKLFAEAKKIILMIQSEQLEQQLFKVAKIKEQLGMFFLKTAFPEVYGERSKRPLTIKFQSKIRGKEEVLDIPDLKED